MSVDYDTKNLIGRWGETLEDFIEDEESIVSITKDGGVHLLNDDDIDIVRTVATEGNGLDVEDNVWVAVAAR
ncbi:hypothetical protein V6N13_074431 [Hibiscus sabdariffa]